MNETLYLGFFDELSKIAADFKFLGPTAQGYANTLKGIKAGKGSMVENAAFKAQNLTKDMRALKAQQAAAAKTTKGSDILAKVKARNAAGMGAGQRRYMSEGAGAGAFVNPITGRSQHILDRMKAQMQQPQVQQARQAEQQARTGALGAAPKMRIL